MAKLRPGAVDIDLATGGVYGDLDHCPLEDLLESAKALLSLLPKVEHKGLWGLHKDYDAGSYVYTSARHLEVDKDCTLETDMGEAKYGERPFRLTVFTNASRETHWLHNWYFTLIGSVKDGQVSPDIQGIPDLTLPARKEHEEFLQRVEAAKPPVQTTLNLV